MAEDEDEMVIVIVDDEAKSSQNTKPKTVPKGKKNIAQKTSAMETILAKVEKHGQYVDITNDEDCLETEYLEIYSEDEYDNMNDDSDENKKPMTLRKRKLDPKKNRRAIKNVKVKRLKKNKSARKADKKKSVQKAKRKRTVLKPKRITTSETINELEPKVKEEEKETSYIDEICNTYPTYKNDTDKLVFHLLDLMNNTKPPETPPNVFKSNGQLMYVCNICGWESKNEMAAGRHYQASHGTKYLMCYACGVRYTCASNLYKHENRCKREGAELVLRARGIYLQQRGRPNRHRGKKRPPGVHPRFYCQQCPASFRARETLLAHLNSHAGVRPYQCDVCPAAYTCDAALKRHLKCHSNEKFICDHCGKCFNMKVLIKSHLQTHLSKRKYQCDRCDRSFTKRITLTHHLNKIHLNLPAGCPCPVCPKRYSRMSQVKDHMMLKHGLAMITRSMFFQRLPELTNIGTQPATVVHNEELVEDKPTGDQNPPTLAPDHSKPTEKMDYEVPVDNYLRIAPKSSIDNDLKTEVINEIDIQVKIEEERDEDSSNMSGMLLKYIQSTIQPNCKVMKIEDGKLVEVQDRDEAIRSIARKRKE